ncbi:MAG TPA: PLP-dependent aminotransferase family protein [Fimbriimonas sp.]|nr:PLP-dependent aminotransferase family protein [Fimbriimonas sp.]
MEINLDREAKTPVYRQIVEQVRTGILSGRLPLGSTLPTSRQLASQLGIVHLTAFKAYGELQALGLVTPQPRRATRVVGKLPASLAVAALGRLTTDGPDAGYEPMSSSAGLRSMASSVPDPSLFQADELLTEIQALRNESPWLYYYCDSAGVPELLEQIRILLAVDGIGCSTSDLLVTHGGTHALSILLSTMCRPDDAVLVQEPGPLGLRELLASKGLTGVPVRLANDAVDLDHFRSLVAKHSPRAVLVSPDFGHGTGLCMPLESRLSLLQAAASADVVVIEDRSFAAVDLDDSSVPPLAALNPQQVCAIGSFSYSLAPGLRTGYLRAPEDIRSACLARFKSEGISGVGFQQLALARYIARGAYSAHLDRVLPKYRIRRDAMLSSLKAWMPANVSWTRPSGGFSTWISLGSALNVERLYRRALKAGVPFSPGGLFFVDSGSKLRLSYGLLEPEAIREAVRILAGLIGPKQLQ